MKKFFALLLFLVVSILTFSVSAKETKTANDTNLNDAEAPVILVLGDSLSAHYNMTKDEGWVYLLQERLASEGFNHQVINASISGDTTNQGLQRFQPLLDQYNPEFVIIELGGNDGIRGFPPKTIKNNLATLIDTAQDAEAEVLLLGMRIFPNYGQKYSDAFYDNYQQLAEEKNINLLPFFLEGIGDKPELMQDDRVHPNAKAQPLLLENVYPFILDLIQ